MNPLLKYSLPLMLLTACSKDELVTETPAPPADPSMNQQASGTPPLQPAGAGGVGPALDAVVADMQANNFEAASAKLSMLKRMPKTPEEQQKFLQVDNDLNIMLMERAQSDPKAKEAYDNYGRMMLGR